LFQRKILHVMLMMCAVAWSASGGVRAQQNYAVITQNSVSMKTRDGGKLYADIYRPKADGEFPVILMRTPYDKSTGWAVGPAYEVATHGYVVIVQDVRGRYTSEGEWYPFRHESEDGYDTIEWAAALPFSNGKVGMTGGSYIYATRLHILHILRESARWSRPATITTVGRIRAERSNSGSIRIGPRSWLPTRCGD
jgi:predicted acyl esterase